jgi:antitoxin component YwqK of YwqJK toxin-antitoxin module
MKKYLFIVLLVGVCFGQTEKIISRWGNGTPKKVNYYDGKGFDKVLVGVKTYYSNGDLRSKTRYKDNVRDGEYLFHLEGNELLFEGKYINGKPSHDGWIVYKPYKIKGHRTGYKCLFGKNLDEYDSEFDFASKYMVSLTFHDNGEPSGLWNTVSLKNFSDDINKYADYGKSYMWYENGFVQMIMQKYLLGSECLWESTLFFETGEKKTYSKFCNNEENQTTTYYKNGNKMTDSKYMFGKKVYFEYDENENLK